jgi:acyl-CoA dehydrogenase
MQCLRRGGPPDPAAIERHAQLVRLYTPIVKAYVSDEAWRVATLAIQIHGGAGYLRDRPLEQYARDIKVLSIWEGTNYMQAQSLVRDTLGFGRNAAVVALFVDEVRRTLRRRDDLPELAAEFAGVSAALESLVAGLRAIRALVEGGRLSIVSQFCTRFLEMFAEVGVGWVLLEAACVAAKRRASLPPQDRDRPFYEGKIKTARFFIHNILPGVAQKRDLLNRSGKTAIALDEAEFGFAETALVAPADEIGATRAAATAGPGAPP